MGEFALRKVVRLLFERLGQRCQLIEAVAMGMNSPFDLEVQPCPLQGRGCRYRLRVERMELRLSRKRSMIARILFRLVVEAV